MSLNVTKEAVYWRKSDISYFMELFFYMFEIVSSECQKPGLQEYNLN
jgi:hypothetical protein